MSVASLGFIFTILLIHTSATTCTDEVETVIQPDGEVIVKVQFKNLTVVQTSADGYNLMQVSLRGGLAFHYSYFFTLHYLYLSYRHDFFDWQGFEWIQSCYLLVV